MNTTNAKFWHGIMAGEPPARRRAAAIVLCILSAAMVAAQQSFFPFADTHVFFLLAPVALASLLLGPWQGCAIGALAGLSEQIHASYLPFDYYEKYFTSPISSVILFALFGLIMGALFARACRLPRYSEIGRETRGFSSIARISAIVGASFVGSVFATAYFQTSIYPINSMLDLQLPTEFTNLLLGVKSSIVQIVLDAIIIAIFSIAADISFPRFGSAKKKRSIRITFQAWLGVVVFTLFLVASGFAYTLVTTSSIAAADTALADRLDQITNELSEQDILINTLATNGSFSDDQMRSLSDNLYDDFDCDLPGWASDIVIVAKDDKVFASNVSELRGLSFKEIVTRGLLDVSLEDVFKSDTLIEYYQGSGAEISYMRAVEVNYTHLDDTGTYQAMALIPASEVFEYREPVMALIAIVFLVLFSSIFLLAMRLLNRVVVRPIDETNGVLDRITAGDLAQRVSESESLEFSSLSRGINMTVNALEESINEANARIDRELATARAIQENALPTTQPPFPDIDEFDLYATMNPAREVGGDFYDFFELDKGRIGFVVADVSGKGIPAALFMMAAKTQIRGSMEVRPTLAEAISTANRNLCIGNDTGMFVTAFAGIFNYLTGVLTYVNAGHNKPLVMHDNTWTWLNERSGPFMGAFENANYRQFEVRLEPQDEIFAYTDGVNEAWDPNGNLYGNNRLVAFLSTHGNLHPRRLLRALRADLIGWANGTEQSDDITMLALKYGIPPEHGASLVTKARLENFEQVERFLTHNLANSNCPQKVVNQILIAVEELVVNVCSYAYPDAAQDAPIPLRVHFTWRSDPNSIVVEIGDDGVPFNPLAHDDPERPTSIDEARIGGLGLLMTKKMMDEVEYVREGIANVTIITKRW